MNYQEIVNNRFIVFAPPTYNESGGSMALHKLSTILRHLGFCSLIAIWPWMQNRKVSPESRDYLVTLDQINTDTDIVIYPEVINGNPLGARRCVRWMLSDPGKNSADYTLTWGKDDLLVYYGTYTARDVALKPAHSMFILSYTRPPRSQCEEVINNRPYEFHIIRKAARYGVIPAGLHGVNSILLDTRCKNTDDYIRHFRKSSKIVSYDPFSFHSVLAALHGCVSIVKPLSNLSLKEWTLSTCISSNQQIRDLGEGGIPGVAYGTEDLARAKRTQVKIDHWLELQVAEGIESVRRFATLALSHWSH